MRAGAFDLKQKSEGPTGRELRTLVGTGVLTRSLLAVSSKGLVALAELDKIHLLDSQPLLSADASAAPSTQAGVPTPAEARVSAAAAMGGPSAGASASSVGAEKTGLRSLCKTLVGFEVVTVAFNPADEQQLLVVGLKECLALTIGPRGEVLGRLAVDLMLDALGMGMQVHIVSASWLPGSSSKCVVLTNHFIKIYDLAKDKMSPIHYFQALDDGIKGLAFIPNNADGWLTMLALSATGILYTQSLSSEVRGHHGPSHSALSLTPVRWQAGNGPKILTEVIQTPPDLRGRVGAALHYSQPCGLLFTVFADGRCFGLRLNEGATEVLGGFALHSTRVELPAGVTIGSSPPRIAPYLHWHDVPGERGLLIATCRKVRRDRPALPTLGVVVAARRLDAHVATARLTDLAATCYPSDANHGGDERAQALHQGRGHLRRR